MKILQTTVLASLIVAGSLCTLGAQEKTTAAGVPVVTLNNGGEMQQIRSLNKEQRFFNATLEDVEKMVWGTMDR